MAEIKRKPVKITVDGRDYDCFDEDHTVSDIVRYAMDQEGILDSTHLPICKEEG